VRKFSASAAAQLMQCPGSARLEQAIPGFIHPVRDDAAGAKGVGTRFHEQLYAVRALSPSEVNNYASILLSWSAQHYLKRYAQCDDPAKMRQWLDAEYPSLREPADVESIQHLIDWLCLMREYPPKLLRWGVDALFVFSSILQKAFRKLWAPMIHAEKSVQASWLVGNYSTTPDVVVGADDTLWVLDYKTGKIPVSAVDNDQLMYYAACYVAKDPSIERIKLIVSQPDNYSTHAVRRADVLAWMEKAWEAERKILQGDLTLRPGDKCTFCPAYPHSRGDKGFPLCPVTSEMLYPTRIDELAILNI